MLQQAPYGQQLADPRGRKGFSQQVGCLLDSGAIHRDDFPRFVLLPEVIRAHPQVTGSPRPLANGDSKCRLGIITQGLFETCDPKVAQHGL